MKRPLIAVVNQDTIFLELMEELLSEEGYHTYIEKEGDRAYMSIKKHKPDLDEAVPDRGIAGKSRSDHWADDVEGRLRQRLALVLWL